MSKESPNSAPQSNHSIAGGHSRHRGAWAHLVGLLTWSLSNLALRNLLSWSIPQILPLFSFAIFRFLSSESFFFIRNIFGQIDLTSTKDFLAFITPLKYFNRIFFLSVVFI